jgi:competence protein ComEC
MHSLEEHLLRAPFVRLTLVLMAGILWQSSAWGFSFSTLPLALGCLGVFAVFIFWPSLLGPSQQWLAGAAAGAVLFFIGTAITQQQPVHTALPLNEPVWVEAEISTAPVRHARYVKAQAVVRHYAAEGDTAASGEKVILYLAADSTVALPQAGNRVYALVRLQPIPAPGNPDEFDYRQYLCRRKIFVSAFVPAGRYHVEEGRGLGNRLRYLPLRWQQSALQVFRHSVLGEQEYAVLAALTLGSKQWLDAELRTAYISAGAMHILAVSGLHVGIIMAVLGWVLGFLNRRRRGAVLKCFLVIACLWLYAAVVGFSPSVTRATVMFSFVLVGQTLRRPISIYNSLAASAFFMALGNPSVLFDAGFQLSYGAVLGIVYFQPYFRRMMYVRVRFLRGLWQLATVSLAAQIGTLPVSLLHFHMFPNYFLITNLCIITLTGGIVYGGMLLLAVQGVPLVSTLVGYLLQAMLWLLNHIVGFVEALPYSTTQNIYINRWQMACMVAGVGLAAVYLLHRRRRWLWLAAGCLVAIVGIHSRRVMQQETQAMAIVCKVENASYIRFVSGRQSVVLTDSLHLHHDFAFHTANYSIRHGLAARTRTLAVSTVAAHSDTVVQGVCFYRGFIIHQNQVYKVLGDEAIDRRGPALAVDCLVVTAGAPGLPDVALQRYRPRQIVLDASVSGHRAQQWMRAARERRLPLHCVRQEGAFLVHYAL